MQRKYIFYLLSFSFLLTNIVAYLDEGIKTFDYLTRLGDWVALVIYTGLFSFLPIVILILSKGKEKRRLLHAFFGYTPVILLIFMMI